MNFFTVSVFVLPVLILFAGCAGPLRDAGSTRASFTGVPIIGDYDDLDDLDFVIRADSAGRVCKVRVHERSRISNRALLRDLRGWINEIVDNELVQVSGLYAVRYRADSIEYGALELREIAFQDTLSGFEQPYRTDPSGIVSYSLSMFVSLLLFAFSRQ